MIIRKIEHVAIACQDASALRTLLHDTLGLRQQESRVFAETGTTVELFPVGDGHLELIHSVKDDSLTSRWIADHGQGLFHLCLEVDDIVGAIAELRGKNIEFLGAVPRIGHGGARVAFLDPETTCGLLIELAEMPRVEQPAANEAQADGGRA